MRACPISLSFLVFATIIVSLSTTTRCSHALADEPTTNRLFELRTYTTHPGKLDALHARFRDHTNRIFTKHGMDLVGYWTPQEDDGAKNTLIYILAYPSRAARDKSWEGFFRDPQWQKVSAESRKDGPIVKKVESKFLIPTDYSPIK